MWLVSLTYPLLFLSIAVTPTNMNNRVGAAFLLSTPVKVHLLEAGESNAWRGLVPLRSTRTDVERLLNAPKVSTHPFYVYETDKENIIVQYTTTPCIRSADIKAPDAEWDVPVDTVITIMVSPKANLLLRSLKLDLRNYARSEIAHPRGFVHYLSLEDGIGIETRLDDGCEVVMSVTYQPTIKDKGLRCPKNSKTAAMDLVLQR